MTTPPQVGLLGHASRVLTRQKHDVALRKNGLRSKLSEHLAEGTSHANHKSVRVTNGHPEAST